MAHLYHVSPESRLVAGHTVVLDGDEAHHAAQVGRLRQGERIMLGDGRGTIAHAETTQVSRDRVELVVVDVSTHAPLTPPLWLVQALAKGGRDEHAIEMATEVGVSRVIPLQASRSVAKWEGPKLGAGRQRWQRIVREASKQSLQPHVAVVGEPVTVRGFIEGEFGGAVLVLDQSGEPIGNLALDHLAHQPSIALMVGPEGGFTGEEKSSLVDSGALLVRLGPGVLRTSSAGPIALGLLHQMLGHWDTPPRHNGDL